MGAAVRGYPFLRSLVATRITTFRHGETELFNPNRLLSRYEYANGIKTGYHEGADFCITASAERDGMELIAVVMGAQHRRDRFDAAQALFEDAFDTYRLLVPVRAGEVLAQRAPVWGGIYDSVPVRAGADARVVVRRSDLDPVERYVTVRQQPAPVATGERVGRVVVRVGDRVLQIPAVAAAHVDEASPWELFRHGMWGGLLARFASLVVIH
jgi:D-alanyl-D-alanine carboxypeptidase (penicillin-binding protein 5/6)